MTKKHAKLYSMQRVHDQESYAAEMGFELATPGSAGRHSTDLTMEPGLGPG